MVGDKSLYFNCSSNKDDDDDDDDDIESSPPPSWPCQGALFHDEDDDDDDDDHDASMERGGITKITCTTRRTAQRVHEFGATIPKSSLIVCCCLFSLFCLVGVSCDVMQRQGKEEGEAIISRSKKKVCKNICGLLINIIHIYIRIRVTTAITPTTATTEKSSTDAVHAHTQTLCLRPPDAFQRKQQEQGSSPRTMVF